MKVEELILDGFKSYATRTVISGWDPQFNAITGLNGSGKSNILDAICFVLGIASMSTVRASNLQDLIYKRGQAGVTKASVTIVFDNNEISKSPIGFENFPKISVTRQIILGGSSKYLINGHKAQQQTVLNLFQSVQLNINNPNFLIMQGKITKVLNMKPSEILSLIEEAAGTRTFEERKEKAQRTMAKKELKLLEIRNLLQEEIEPKLEKLRTEKRTYLEYQQTQTDLEKLSRVISAHDYVIYSRKFDEHLKLLNERESILNDLTSKVERLGVEITNLNSDLSTAKKQQEKELQKDGKLKELESQENDLSELLVRLTTTRDIAIDNLKAELKKFRKILANIEQLKVQLGNNTDIYNRFEQQYQSGKEELSQLKKVHAQREELLSTLKTGVSSSGGMGGGYQSQLKDAKLKLAQSNVEIEQSKLKTAHFQQQLANDEPKLHKAQADSEVIKAEIQNYQSTIEQKERNLLALGYDSKEIAFLRSKELELKNRLNQLNNELMRFQRELGNNLDFHYTKPYPQFDHQSVKGVAAQLFQLNENHNDKSIALQKCAGGRLYNVVVDSSDTASQLLERGQLKKRVTIIPLDKISSKVINPKAVSAAQQLRPGKVDLAIDLIDFDEQLRKAMEYIFGSTLICKDPETASTVTYNRDVRARSITLEGDVYDPEGTVSGGSNRNTSSLLLTIQQYNKVQNEISHIQGQLDEIRDKIRAADKIGHTTKALQNEINLSNHELNLLQRKLENSSASEILKRNEQAHQEILKLQEVIENQEQMVKQFQLEITNIEKDIKEFSSDKGSKLQKLEKEVQMIYDQLSCKEDEINEKFDKYQAAQMESEQQQTELKSLEDDLEQTKASIDELEANQKQINVDGETLEIRLQECRAKLEDEKATLLGISEEINELAAIIQQKNQLLNDSKLSIQKLNHELEKSFSILSNLKNHINRIIEEQEWVLDNNVLQSIVEQYPNVNLDECHEQLSILEEKFQGMRRKVNTNIMNMIDNVEKKEASLKQMIKTIEKDKSKIENTVEKLNGYKRSTLDVTYKKVSVDFGNIFADLLPGSFAKLVPVDNEDVTKGLEVKVKLGPVWKESLVELSGGQRSLIALSLIMALLQFKPAPMYILDEVDAALDLSHTQNIGHLIKTRFKGSQFIVVSLKEGMFTNANRVFRTRFQDGTSVVSVM